MEKGICIHAMQVYYSNVHKVTTKGCTGNLHCKYFQEGKGKTHYLTHTWRNYIVCTHRNACADQLDA